MESTDYMKCNESLQREIADLKDLLLTLVGCVEYQEEKPYDAYLCRLLLSGEERVKLTLILSAITVRLKGECHDAKPQTLLEDSPLLTQAYSDGSITVREAIDLLSQAVGSANAEGVLKAFNQQYQNGLKLE